VMNGTRDNMFVVYFEPGLALQLCGWHWHW